MVVIRYQSHAANAVLTHRFQSVATPPKRDGKLLPGVTRVPLRAPFGSFFFTVREPTGAVGLASRWQRVVRYSRCTFNSFGALAQACKQSSRRLTECFHSFASVFAHDEQHGRGAMQCPTTALKELTK